MPWHQEPMKDVISCDKLRGGANILRSGDFRMGKPTARYRILNQIGIRGEPPELKHLSRARKRHQHEIPQVVASERGGGQTGGSNISGVTDSNVSKYF